MSRQRLLGLVAASAAVVAAGAVALNGGAIASATSVRPLAATAGCGKAPALTSGAHTIQSSGQNRSYIVRIPANYDNNRPYRLVFGFHWNGGTANDVDSGGSDGYNWSYYGLRRLADGANNSAIFVAPQGNNNGWANPGGRDVTFVDDMIRQVEAGLCVDTTQVYSTGFSYGGAMSYALACTRASVFRAVAVYAGASLSGCGGGTQPIAYIGVHGIRDNPAGGRALRDTFVRNNGCTPQNPPEPAQGSLTHIVTAYSGCRAGYPVAWAAFDGGHDPGPIDGCTCGGWRSWTPGVVWDFFSQFATTPPPTTPPPTTPSPTTPPPAGSWIVGTQSGRCVTAPNPSAGTPVQLQDCNGQPNQAWTYTAGRQLRTSDAMCLDANGGGTGNGTTVIIWTCNGQPNQQWTVNQGGAITAVQSGLCLDANGGGTANGTRLILWSCHTGANQRWNLGSADPS